LNLPSFYSLNGHPSFLIYRYHDYIAIKRHINITEGEFVKGGASLLNYILLVPPQSGYNSLNGELIMFGNSI